LNEVDAAVATDGQAATIADLARSIGHDFARPDLLAEAVTHPSALGVARRHGGARRSYQRLEWFGDRVLGLVVAELLWRRFAGEPEGHLTRRYSSLVRRETVARIAERVGLGRHIVLSPVEATAGTAHKPATLADACEALIAAIYIDGGFAAAFAFVERFWQPLIDEMEAPPRDPKATLQEWAQARSLALPVYQVAASGPDHARRYTVTATLADFAPAAATASSIRQAEVQAAASLLESVTDSGQPQPRSRRRRR
jgi:ribonuclease III